MKTRDPCAVYFTFSLFFYIFLLRARAVLWQDATPSVEGVRWKCARCENPGKLLGAHGDNEKKITPRRQCGSVEYHNTRKGAVIIIIIIFASFLCLYIKMLYVQCTLLYYTYTCIECFTNENPYEFNESLHRLFVNTKQVYHSIDIHYGKVESTPIYAIKKINV